MLRRVFGGQAMMMEMKMEIAMMATVMARGGVVVCVSSRRILPFHLLV